MNLRSRRRRRVAGVRHICRAGAAVVALTLASAGALPLAGQSASVHVLEAQPGSSLTIRGSTTIGAGWSCHASNVEARVAIADAPPGGGLIPAIRGVSVFVKVATLRCQSGLMERAMRHALRADRDTAAQYIRGVFEIFDEIQPQTPEEAHLAGALKVAGVERNVFLKAHVEAQPGGALRVRSEVPMTLSAFSIERPRVLWGAVRARDEVSVEVDLRFPALGVTRPDPAGAAASPRAP